MTVPQEVPHAATGCAAPSVQRLQINAVQTWGSSIT
jgi:hypothetical protein